MTFALMEVYQQQSRVVRDRVASWVRPAAPGPAEALRAISRQARSLVPVVASYPATIESVSRGAVVSAFTGPSGAGQMNELRRSLDALIGEFTETAVELRHVIGQCVDADPGARTDMARLDATEAELKVLRRTIFAGWGEVDERALDADFAAAEQGELASVDAEEFFREFLRPDR